MLKRILKITVICLISLIVLGGAGVYWLGRTAEKKPQALFNWIYKHPMVFFTKDPNALLVETVSNKAPGKALDIAMGEGRNAVWLAMKGWDVTGFDISDEALRQAENRAGKAGVKINAVKAASETFEYGHEQWDLIVMSYVWAPIRDAGYIARLRDSLKPGGLLVFEHYRKSYGAQPGETRKDFGEFKILRYEELVAQSDWVFQAKQPLVRMVATR